MLFCYGWQKPLSGFADFQRGAFLLAGGQTCRRSGPERPGSAARDSTQSGGRHRQGTAPRAGPLPAPNNSQPTDRSTSRPERPRARRRQLTGRSRRQSRGPERPGRPGQRPAKDTTRTADQPPDPASRRDTTSNSKHESTTVYQNEKGREARTGRDTRHVCPSLAGALAGKAPACGRLAALRGACLGLAGRGNGRHSRPQAAFPAPRRARSAGKAALAPPVRAAVLIAAPRRGKGCSSSPQPGPRLGWGAAPPARGPGPLRRAASA